MAWSLQKKSPLACGSKSAQPRSTWTSWKSPPEMMGLLKRWALPWEFSGICCRTIKTYHMINLHIICIYGYTTFAYICDQICINIHSRDSRGYLRNKKIQKTSTTLFFEYFGKIHLVRGIIFHVNHGVVLTEIMKRSNSTSRQRQEALSKCLGNFIPNDTCPISWHK